MNKARKVVHSSMGFKWIFPVFYFVTLSLGIVACKKDEAPSAQEMSLHTDYFPIQEGAFVIYDATEMTHDDAVGQHDTVHYQLKTLVADQYIDNQGRKANEFHRLKSTDGGTTFFLTDVYTVIVDGQRAELVEENQRIIKLFLPPKLDFDWDINVYNSRGEKRAYYEDIHSPKTINGLNFDSTVNAVEQKLYSLVDYRYQYEIYAKGVGLVKKYYKDLTIQDFDTLDAQKGNEIYYTVLTHGFE